MSDDFNFDIMQNEAELEKLCTDSVDLINYARNVVVNHVNTVQIIRSFLSQDKHIEHINVHLIILMRIMHF